MSDKKFVQARNFGKYGPWFYGDDEISKWLKGSVGSSIALEGVLVKYFEYNSATIKYILPFEHDFYKSPEFVARQLAGLAQADIEIKEPKTTYSLEVTAEEMAILRFLLNKVGGDPETTIRKYAKSLSEKIPTFKQGEYIYTREAGIQISEYALMCNEGFTPQWMQTVEMMEKFIQAQSVAKTENSKDAD